MTNPPSSLPPSSSSPQSKAALTSEPQAVDYKGTIRLPQTDFPMKGNLPKREPEILEFWEKNQIYEKMVQGSPVQGLKKPPFYLPDGPPYANGSIHIGHHLNKTLKDIVIKYKNMRGFKAPFIPGWDCHGLPIEHAVMKELGSRVSEKSDEEIRGLCRQEALKWVEIQRKQFRRLGILADWNHPYMTLDPQYEAEEVREFAREFSKGVIYWGTKPVYWNWSLQTALAEAEVEYAIRKSPSIYVKFPVEASQISDRIMGAGKKLEGKKIFFLIWTTTPWTLPANQGICLNPDFDYGLYPLEGSSLGETSRGSGSTEIYILAQGLKQSVENIAGISLGSPLFSLKGKDLEGVKAKHCFYENQDSVVVLGSHVSLEAGTGCVHTAPGHGIDDYKVGLKYGLDILSPVNEEGKFTKEVKNKDWEGLHIFKANPLIIQTLQDKGNVVYSSEIEHSYPHCWRSKIPLIFRATPQWFLGLDLEGSQIRRKALSVMDGIQFFPSWGRARFQAMMESRPDWCLSRQRIWGVPIPIYYSKKTGKPLADERIMLAIADLIETQGGIDAFYRTPPGEVIAQVYGTKGGGGSSDKAHDEEFIHGKDILDVWFDSGVVHAAIQARREGLGFPADLYLEGSDQHRGWFNTSLLSALSSRGEVPFRALVTHGFVMDSQGLKMSKSKGNSVDPLEVAQRSGIEILRLWTAYEDYGQDLSCGQAEIERVTETYRRIRNTMRFLLGVVFDFNPETDSIPFQDLTPIDQWALGRLHRLVEKVTLAYDEYSFYKVYHALNNFFTVDLSATYLDILKDRLYTGRADGKLRRSAQTVLCRVAYDLVRLMAPILSFLSEEVYSHMKVFPPGTFEEGAETHNREGRVLRERPESVFLLDFPSLGAGEGTEVYQRELEALERDWDQLLSLRGEVQKALENLRTQKVIGSSLEALVRLKIQASGGGGSLPLIRKYESHLKEFFIVSQVVIEEVTSSLPETPGGTGMWAGVSIGVERAPGLKCQRCWIYSVDTNTNPQYPGVCLKCVDALSAVPMDRDE